MNLEGRVQVHRRITGCLYRETPECAGPRGWAESAICHARFELEGDRILMELEGSTYDFPPELMEAALQMWEERDKTQD